jgi:hypothetical protein
LSATCRAVPEGGDLTTRPKGAHSTHLRRKPCGGGPGNHFDVDTGEEFWVSGVKKDRADRHWAGSGPVHIDHDVRDEYERLIP